MTSIFLDFADFSVNLPLLRLGHRGRARSLTRAIGIDGEHRHQALEL
jgi:hypothetical protein